ncbi:hypothetical protein TNIN_96401 [Trichonephila inaurata madagascariensis]|uniref:Uncharacterized protein n=1 Tax=Trichonephila inaurata madagascariensis TaxID=2747483 RepID=A0A8X6YDL8_9ARAC|nr:hypothetical protein TNIN_96401 [Trichonephila inaurata madagascariensis]
MFDDVLDHLKDGFQRIFLWIKRVQEQESALDTINVLSKNRLMTPMVILGAPDAQFVVGPCSPPKDSVNWKRRRGRPLRGRRRDGV